MSKQPTTLLEKLEKLKEAKAHADALLAEVKQEALSNAEAAVLQLNELGFHYFLQNKDLVGEATPKASRHAKTEAEKSERHAPKDVSCPICGYRTEKPHDRRSHRAQAEKRPFTDEELAELGMKRVEPASKGDPT